MVVPMRKVKDVESAKKKKKVMLEEPTSKGRILRNNDCSWVVSHSACRKDKKNM